MFHFFLLLFYLPFQLKSHLLREASHKFTPVLDYCKISYLPNSFGMEALSYIFHNFYIHPQPSPNRLPEI